jgi:cell division protein FtsL
MEFQMRRDIHNRPRREVDRAGQRRMWTTAAMVVVVLGVLLAIAVLRTRQADLGYRIGTLQAMRAKLEAERRHLVAERESLRSLKRIEQLAMEQLQLVKPTKADAFVLERVRSSKGPSSAVVARR